MEDCTAQNAALMEFHPSREVRDRVVVGWMREPVKWLVEVQKHLRAIVHGENNVNASAPASVQKILRDLQVFKPDEIEPLPWFDGLATAIETIIQLRGHFQKAPIEMLVAGGRQTDGYLPALSFILDSIEGTAESMLNQVEHVTSSVAVSA